jgi:outer membrane lipoprotein
VGVCVRIVLIALLLCLSLAGCTTIPQALRADNLSTVTPSIVRDGGGAGVGDRVRWGGSVLEVNPAASETCISILSRPLDSFARPTFTDVNFGRFLACGDAFYDPAVFTKDRSVTVLGKVEGVTDGTVDGAPYRFPRLRIETLYLWPIVVYPPPYYYYYYGPYWGGPWWYGPGWGPWYGPGPYWWGW